MLLLCGGMIRSGSSLQFNLAKDIAELEGGTYIHANSDIKRLAMDGVYDDKWVVHKTHVFPNYLPLEEFESGNIRVVMTYRDIRDVVVSTMRFRALQFGKIIESIVEETVDREQEWLSLVPPRYLHRTSYESIIKDPHSEVRAIGDLVEVDLSDLEVSQIADEHSLESVLDKTSKMAPFSWDAHSHYAQNHIGGIKHGQWRDELSKEQVAIVEDLVMEWLIENGYELS